MDQNKDQSGAETIGGSKSTIEEGIKVIRMDLGLKADEYLPKDKFQQVQKITREGYISAEGFNGGLDESDGFISRAYLDTKEQVIVIGRKEGFPSPMQGIDMREMQTWIYLFDGNTTLTAREPNGKETVITGENGDPEKLVAYMTQEKILGRSMLESQVFERAVK